MGGPEIRNRKVLAISSSMRNVGVCLPIASNYFAGTDVTVPMLAFSGIMIPMNMVFSVVAGRMQGGKEEMQSRPKLETKENQFFVSRLSKVEL